MSDVTPLKDIRCHQVVRVCEHDPRGQLQVHIKRNSTCTALSIQMK